MTQAIHQQVHYRKASEGQEAGFYYQVSEVSPLRGPFKTRASAIADAAWTLNEDLRKEQEARA